MKGKLCTFVHLQIGLFPVPKCTMKTKQQEDHYMIIDYFLYHL